jgi:hypothetical protein
MFLNEVREPEELVLKRVRFCGPRRTQFKTSLLALNRSTRLSEIKTGRVGAIGMDGRAPKIEGEESEVRVFHSAKGFMLVEVSMVVFLVLFETRTEEVVNGMCSNPEIGNPWEEDVG